MCALAGKTDQFVKPFRIEVYQKGHKSGCGIAGGGAKPAGRGMRRKPHQPITEEEETTNEYSSSDQLRFQNRGGNALAGGGISSSFDWVDVKEERQQQQQPSNDEEETAPAASRLSQYKAAVQHRCEGCATGICRSRKLPISGLHDVHDGCTVSTSASVVTNSVIDKSEFIDQDVDFDDWLSDDGMEDYITLGSNGKMLRG